MTGSNSALPLLLSAFLALSCARTTLSSSGSEVKTHNANDSHQAFKLLTDVQKGDVCREGKGSSPNYVCVHSNDCESLAESIRSNRYLDICEFYGREPIVCCPASHDEPHVVPSDGDSETEFYVKSRFTNIASEKCRQYESVQYPKSNDTNSVDNSMAGAEEFPHMAALGYGNTTKNSGDFKCGGSLISERWILTAAHCHNDSIGSVAKWARLGSLYLNTTAEDHRPFDYKIVQHVIHPKYQPPALYNDIALFRLDRDVEFSAFIRPICLNSDPLSYPSEMIAMGWGSTDRGVMSDALVKIPLTNYPASECNETYISKNDRRFKYGLLPNSMICFDPVKHGEDACLDFGGGPLQRRTDDRSNSAEHVQFGITSFGVGICDSKELPGVFTRVSKYIKWIEEIVWTNGTN